MIKNNHLMRRRHVTTFEIQIWLPDFILGINPLRIFCAWPNWAEVICYLANDTVVSSLFIDRQLNIRIYAWKKWKYKLRRLEKIVNMAPKYTGSYFTVAKVSSWLWLTTFQMVLQGVIAFLINITCHDNTNRWRGLIFCYILYKGILVKHGCIIIHIHNGDSDLTIDTKTSRIRAHITDRNVEHVDWSNFSIEVAWCVQCTCKRYSELLIYRSLFTPNNSW